MEDSDLMQASKTGDIDRLRQILASEVNIKETNHRGQSALHLAVEGGYLEVVKELVNHNAEVNMPLILYGTAINFTPVLVAASCGHLDIIKYLCEKGGILYEDDGPYGYTNAMLGAAASGNLEMVKYLCEEKKLPINESDQMGITPLHMAIEKTHGSIVRYLVEHGANPNIKSKGQLSPLDYTKNKINSKDVDDLMKEKYKQILECMDKHKR